MAPLSVKESLTLAGQNLLAILNPEDDYLPYWEATVHKNVPAELKRWWPAHNIGRWWDAMLRLEEAIGFDIPKKVEVAMLDNTKRFFDNPDCISLNPKPHPWHLGTKDEGLIWDLHSIREGMLALHGLARWRKNDWAATMGRKMVLSLNGKLKDDGTWDLERFDACQKRGKGVIHNASPCDTHGRLLEAMVWFFEATGDEEVLRFSDRIARWHFNNTTQPDGAINPASHADHTHSYLGTLRGLLLYGRMTHQHEYIDRVTAAYRVNVPRLVKESGYTSHNMVVESFGETTSPGDAAQLALWLAQDGHADLLDDADRIVRSRILPSQILEAPPIQPAMNNGKDPCRDIGKRIIGAYGGCTSHPHGGKLAVTDVTSADVHTLVDIYKHIAPTKDGSVEVLFHLDYEDSRVKVDGQRGQKAELNITLKKSEALAIRVPGWTPRDSVRFRLGDKTLQPVMVGAFARCGRMPAGSTVTMEYDLPERRSKETDLGVEYEFLWRGDDVLGVRPNADFLPMYPDLPESR